MSNFDDIEQLLAEAEQLGDPRARSLAKALAAALVELVGQGLARTCELGGPELARKLADDELVGNLLVLCDRHPDAAPVRAAAALAAAKRELGSLGVELDACEPAGDAVRVRVRAQRGEVTEPAKVRALVEAIVVARAPDVSAIHVELEGKPVVATGFVSIERLRAHTP